MTKTDSDRSIHEDCRWRHNILADEDNLSRSSNAKKTQQNNYYRGRIIIHADDGNLSNSGNAKKHNKITIIEGRHNIHADDDNSSNSSNAKKYNKITIIEGATIFTQTMAIQVTQVMPQNITTT